MKVKKQKIVGIYCIENIVNDKKYIGQSIDYARRKLSHINDLNKGKDDCLLLQRAWEKYGKENFVFYLIIECEESRLNNLEIFYIKEYNSHYTEHGYNMSWGGEALFRGRNHTEETKKKLSDNNKGENNPNYGNKMSDESKLLISESNTGRIPSEKTRQKMSESHMGIRTNLGKKLTEEHKEHISEGGKGKKLSEKSKQNISNGKTGIKVIKNTSSKFVGVCFDKIRNKWSSYITVNKVTFYLGLFETEIEAAIAYNEAAIELLGWKARLNQISEEDIMSIWEK